MAVDTTVQFPEPGADAPAVTAGTRIGRYVVRGTIGRGGMGVVLLADDEELGREVAIKLLRHREFGTAEDAVARARLLREAQAMAMLAHPNVITVHDVGTYAGRVFLAMEYVEGITLRDWLAAAKRPQSAILRCFVAAGRGLAAAHRAGLVHRDFKPDNVILGKGDAADPHGFGRVLVLDFGLARVPDSHPSLSESTEQLEATATDHGIQSLTMSGWVVGTPLYMAPEQHLGQAVPASDQFAFCVALYDALFGEQPFAGESIDELAAHKQRGRMRPFPTASLVPRSVRDVLRRGLAANAEDRFARMDDLVDALERGPIAARRRTTIVVGLLGGAAVLAATVPWRGASASPCAAVDSSLAAIWDGDRRREVEHALAAASGAYAGETTATVLGRLDAYAAELIAARRTTCEATQLDADPALDRAMTCLQRREQSLAAMVDVLAAADAGVGERAVDAVGSLPTIDACAGDQVELPADPGLRARIDAAHEAASRIAALTGAGRYPDARAQVETLLVEAAAIGHLPLLADAEYLHAEVLQRQAEHESAAAAYTRAIGAAGSDDRRAAEAWIGLLFTTGHSLAQYEIAAGHARHAEAAVQRLGEPVELEAQLLANLGTIAHDQGDYERAQSLLEQALALRETLGEDAIDGSTLVNLGRTLASRGRIADARATVQRAIAMIETRYGPAHPQVAKTLTHLGAIEFEAGEYAAAKSRWERALAIQEQALGPSHPEVAFSLNNVANALMTERRLDEALVYYERARDILRAKLGADHPDVGRLTFNMAELAKQLKQYDRSQTEYRAAIATFEHAFGPEHPDVGRALNNLASVQYDAGQYAESERNYAASLAVVEKALGPKHPGLAYPLVGLGLVHLATDDPRAAIPVLERALALRAGGDVDPVDRADAQFAMARALWDGQGDRTRALELAQAAIVGFEKAEPGYPTAKDEAVGWLVERRR